MVKIKYEKFKPFKTVFAVLLVSFVLSFVLSLVLCKRDRDFAELLTRICTASEGYFALIEASLILWVFTAGPTIYAPVSSFLAVAFYGLVFGARLLAAMPSSGYVIFSEAFFSSILSYLLIIYSSFAMLTGLNIFTAPKVTKRRMLFDGVMFRAEGFSGIFNLRYIISYIVFFIVFLTAVILLYAIKIFFLDF